MLIVKGVKNGDFLDYLDFNLKIQDKIECGLEEVSEEYIKFVIKDAIKKSKFNYIVLYENRILSIFGIREVEVDVGMPWFLSEEINKDISLDFLEISKEYISNFKNLYPILYNYTYKNNSVSHKWLEFLGFKLLKNDVIVRQESIELFRFEWRKEWEEY